MSVNLSSVQLAQLGLIERLDQILRDGYRWTYLKLEITESAIMQKCRHWNSNARAVESFGSSAFN
jgi:EAL domain-containing protein (putative c-di-GMP-specific phosphodiesterase class I)